MIWEGVWRGECEGSVCEIGEGEYGECVRQEKHKVGKHVLVM